MQIVLSNVQHLNRFFVSPRRQRRQHGNRVCLLYTHTLKPVKNYSNVRLMYCIFRCMAVGVSLYLFSALAAFVGLNGTVNDVIGGKSRIALHGSAIATT